MEEQKLPESLIKYYNCNKYSCDAFIDNYLWASNPADFNDPFDCSIFSLDEYSFDKKWLLKNTNSWSHKWWTEDKNQNRDIFYNQYLRFLGILCFNEFEIKNQDLLWGYYNNQKGFAVEFDTKILKENLKELPLKINYKEPKEFEIFRIDDGNLFRILKKWIIQKKIIWDRETEWRFIFNDLIVDPKTFLTKPETRRKKYNLKAVKTIYLGYRFFNKRNFIPISDDVYIYVLGKEDKLQNKLLSHLAFPSTLAVKHMFPKNNEFQLFPRKCRINKQDEGRFKITYLE